MPRTTKGSELMTEKQFESLVDDLLQIVRVGASVSSSPEAAKAAVEAAWVLVEIEKEARLHKQ